MKNVGKYFKSNNFGSQDYFHYINRRYFFVKLKLKKIFVRTELSAHESAAGEKTLERRRLCVSFVEIAPRQM
jgi:hypothetical protein